MMYSPSPARRTRPGGRCSPMTAWRAWLRNVRDRYVARKYGKAYADRWYAEMIGLARHRR